jgi:hypothetical protein
MTAATTTTVPIDIVVNNYNYGVYVCDAVDSARAQDHPNVNVIVVDDGSTDDSRERLRAYDGQIELVLKDNGGQAAALNAGFARCRGEAVIFLDADDMLTPTVATRAAAAFVAEPGAARVQFRMGTVDAAGRDLATLRPPAHEPLPSGDLRRSELAFPFDMAWVGGGNAFSAVALRRIMPIPEREYGRWGADWYLVHLTALLGPVVAIEQVGMLYRFHGANAFEPARPVIDLDRVRREIAYQQTTAGHLGRLADELGLERPDPILSLSNVGLRIVSHKLAPAEHPVAGDNAPALLRDAVRAARRRYNVPLTMRIAIVGLLAAIAAAPRRLAPRLAELFVFPERRPRTTRMLERLRGGR